MGEAPRETLLQRAKDMRNNPTEPEKHLWRHLSGSKLDGHKFRRQAVINGCIADFLCPAKMLVVEVDGETHDIDADRPRDERLAKLGYAVLHVTNVDVMTNMEGVLLAISQKLDALPDRWNTTPYPSSEEEGLYRPHNLKPLPFKGGVGGG